jgi:hypothetical protein
MKALVFGLMALVPSTAFSDGPPGTDQGAMAVPPAYRFGFSLDLAYEHRLDPEGEFLIERTLIKNGIDLQRDYFDRMPFARMAFDYGNPEGLAIAIEGTFRAQWAGGYGKPDNFPGAGNGEPIAFENYFISRGVMLYRLGESYISFGRDKPDFDGILYGSLLPGRRLPYLDSLRARIEMGNFTIDWMAATIQALRSWEGSAFDVNPDTDAPSDSYGFEADVNPTTIVEGLTRFSWKLGKVSLSVADHVMMARRNNRFYLTDFFPIISRHQTSVAQTNNSLVLELGWKPFDGLTLQGQAGFDDVSAEMFGVSDTSSPTISAYVLGGEFEGNAGRDAIDAALEIGCTHYLWGNYDGGEVQPNDQNPFLRFQYRFLFDAGAALLPLTSPYGPGALWLTTAAGYTFRQPAVRLGLEVLVLVKNQDANLIDTEYLHNTTTAGAPAFVFTSIAVPLKYRVGSWAFGLKPAILIREGEYWPEATIAAQYMIRTGSARSLP